MKKLLFLLLLPIMVKSQSPKIKILYVDSAFMNQVATWYLPQVAISGYYDNLLHIPNITINGVSHSVTDGQSWTVSASSPITSVFGRTGTIISTSGDYNTSQVTEGTNLYWTTARGDARYPQLSGSYSNPIWLTALAAAKVTGLSTVATTGSYSDLTGKPTIYTFSGSTSQYTRGDGTYATFPTSVSSFTNDAGYLTGMSGINVLSKSASYTVLSTDFAAGKQPVILLSVDASSGANTQTLPTTGLTVGQTVQVLKTDATANVITIANLATDNLINIKGSLKSLVWDGSSWKQN